MVVEIYENFVVGTPPRRQPFGPRVERGAPVTGPGRGRPLVQPQVSPVGRAPHRRAPLGAVGETEGGVVALEQRPHSDFLGEPALVPELDRDPPAGREAF